MRILIIDNNVDKPWTLCADFRRHLEGEVMVRRAPEQDIPNEIDRFTHVVISGSKTCILDSSPWVMRLMDYVRLVSDRGIPLLGVCYGHQIIARAFGGDSVVRISPTPEIGWVEIEQSAANPLLEGLPRRFFSFQSHFEEVCQMPSGFLPTASTPRCPIQSYYVEGKLIFGVQFHPERSVEEGQQAIERKRKARPPVPKDCIFNEGKAKSVFSEDVANTVFRNFLRQRRCN